MAPGLQASYSSPQAPALSQMYAYGPFNPTNSVGEAYSALDGSQEKRPLFFPCLHYLTNVQTDTTQIFLINTSLLNSDLITMA